MKLPRLLGAALMATVLHDASVQLAAQDVTVKPFAWASRDDPPEQLPAVRSPLRPDFPRELRETTDFGYVLLDFFVDEKGQYLKFQQLATSSAYLEAVSSELARAEFQAGRRAGQPVTTHVQSAVIFNPASAAPGASDATPRLLHARLAIDANRRGKVNEPVPLPEVVWATVSIDAAGKPVAVQGPPTALAPLLEKVVRLWRFAPARRGGEPVSAEVRVPFLVLSPASIIPQGEAIVPRPVKQVKPAYPPAQRVSGRRGEVLVDFTVDIEGRVTNAKVVRSLNPAFDEPALDAIRQWKFEPGRRGGIPVSTHLQTPVVFVLDGITDGGESGVTIRKKAQQDKLPPEFRYDVAPSPIGRVAPVYPYALLRDDTTGSATVHFVVSERGNVISAAVFKTTNLEFGAALLAAVERFEFKPALKDGRPTRAMLTLEQEFNRGEEFVANEDKALLSLERKYPERIVAASKLDAPLKPVSTRQAEFPLSLLHKVEKGQAVVEFLVDEGGRARLPRTVKASDAAFGYAAVQAVGTWRFEPPQSGGKAVIVRVRAPFNFRAPPAQPPAP